MYMHTYTHACCDVLIAEHWIQKCCHKTWVADQWFAHGVEVLLNTGTRINLANDFCMRSSMTGSGTNHFQNPQSRSVPMVRSVCFLVCCCMIAES